MNTPVLLLMLFSSISFPWLADPEVRVMRNNQKVTLLQPQAMTEHVVLLLESCSVNSTASGEPSEMWNDAVASGSFIHVNFPDARTLAVMSKLNHKREDRSVDQILLPLPEGKWPTHILVRSGKEIWTFSKYPLSTLQRVVSEPALQLSSVRPYDWLIRLQEK